MHTEERQHDAQTLERFLTAQHGIWQQALRELAAGEKRSHWMWFIFPQLRGLGHSAVAWHFGIAGAAEAKTYAAHPVLGARLRRCTEAVQQAPQRAVSQIFGPPDDLKFHSCMTLFAEAAQDPALFTSVLATRFGGRRDPATLALLRERYTAGMPETYR